VLVGALALLASVPLASAQSQIRCESRNHQYEFCASSIPVAEARLMHQESGAACVQGRSWGYDRRGIWVDRGCAGLFEVRQAAGYPADPGRPGPGGDVVRCESRDYRYEFCAAGGRVVSATLVRQVSRQPCVLGRNWGWKGNGIWVNEGCEGEFRIRTDYRPGPPAGGPGLTLCESHEYRYNFCRTGPIRGAQLVEQRSEARCVEGRSWGWRNDGVWVDDGCEAVFRVRPR
jgi:hypothetical protein